MKKRTFGRIAAVGLAGLTAIPAVAIVASADVAVDNVQNSISGEAYYFKFSATKRTYQSIATYNNTTNTVVFNDNNQTGVDNAPTAIGAYPVPSNGVYYTEKNMANTIKSGLETARDQENSKQKDDILKGWKNQWEDYAWYMRNKAAIEALEADATMVSPSGTVFHNYDTASQPNEATKDYVQYTVSVTIEPKSMKNISEEIGSKVNITNGIITPGSKYSVNTAAGSTTPGSTGSYGTYDIPVGYRYADSKSYTVDYVTWYPNLSALRAVWGSATAVNTRVPSPAYSATYCWFDPTDGNYYTTSQASNGYHPYAVLVSSGTSASNTEYAIYRVDNGYYYYSWSSACAAAGNDTSRITFIRNYTTAGNYFSRLTGNFYNYYEDALYSSNNNASLVVTLSANSAYGYYGYDDPYYYYFLNRGNSGSSSSSSLGGSSVKIGNKSGWTNVRSSIRSAKSGASLDVTMNGETSIPEEILTALDGKDVDVNFKLKNGAVVTINGQDVSTPKDVNVAVTYNTKNVPSGLVKKATNVNNSLSTSQISVSSNTFGGKIGVTVKYSANRAGCSAKIYRYNSSRNSLQLVDTSTVSSSGKVTFDGMTQGGDFVIVLFEK